MIDKQSITGIILAGGKSRRMGMEKALVKFQGKALIDHSIDVLQELCGTILISANSDSFKSYPYQIVNDIFPDSGPMGGIYSCLKFSQTKHNLVLSCDTPFVTPRLFEFLLSVKEKYECVVPWYGAKHFEPLCAYYNKDILEEMENFIRIGNFKIPDLFKVSKTKAVLMDEKLPFYHVKYFFNINSKSELERASRK